MTIDIKDLVKICISTYSNNDDAKQFYDSNEFMRLNTTDRWSIFLQIKTNSIIVAFRGTNWGNISDLITNAHILIGSFESSPCFLKEWRELQKTLRVIIPFVSPHAIIFCGHSMGSKYSVAAQDMFHRCFDNHDGETLVIGFNSATSPNDCRIGISAPVARKSSRIIHYVVDKDPVSQWSDYICGEVVKISAGNHESALERHNIRRMLHRQLPVPRRVRHIIKGSRHRLTAAAHSRVRLPP